MKKKNPIESRSEFQDFVDIEFDDAIYKTEITFNQKGAFGGTFLTTKYSLKLLSKSSYLREKRDEDGGFRICRTTQDSSN